MLRNLFIIISLLLVFTSCTKTKNVRFHGRVTVNCNGSPAVNAGINISRTFDTGSLDGAYLGLALTNENGNYDVILDVNDEGSLVEYSAKLDYQPSMTNRYYIGDARSDRDSKEIEMNIGVATSSCFAFHIKNISPMNSNDKFDTLKVTYYYNGLINENLIQNLSGMNVDTIIYHYYGQTSFYYSYRFTKNGTTTISPTDTLQFPNCLDTTVVNIFY